MTTSMPRYVLCFALLFIAVAAFSQEDTNGDRVVSVLVPVLHAGPEDEIPLPGAHGSLWTTQVWLRNDSAYSFSIIQRGFFCGPGGCLVSFDPGTTKLAPVFGEATDQGGLLVFDPFTAKQVTLSARLLELSRRAQPNGIEVPIVWEHEFLSGVSTLIAIPRRSEGRVTLRIFGPRRRPGDAVEVTALSTAGEPLGSTVLTLTIPDLIGTHVPAYNAILDIAAFFPLVATVDRFDLRITPLVEGMEYWTYVSETDRESQHVLLITPDH